MSYRHKPSNRINGKLSKKFGTKKRTTGNLKSYKKNGNTPKGRTFGNYLRELRFKVNMSISKVGEVLGYSSGQFISNWEREISMPPPTALKKLSSIYHVDERFLVKKYMAFKVVRLERNTLL